jgi:hypothetical protein
MQIAFGFLQNEMRMDDRVAASAKDMVEKAEKKTEERLKRMGQMNDNGMNAIQNQGTMIERKPLTGRETFAHALLMSNEMAYVN